MATYLLMMMFFIFIFGLFTGRTLVMLPLLLLMGFGVMVVSGFQVLGWLIQNPLIFLFVIVMYLLMKKNAPKPKYTRTGGFYYRSGGSAKDFEEFFKQASGFQYGDNGGYYNGQGSFGGFRDKGTDYRTLGIEEGATKEEVKRAFREKAKLHHPDKFANATEHEKIEHEKIFKAINESYENVMKDFS